MTQQDFSKNQQPFLFTPLIIIFSLAFFALTLWFNFKAKNYQQFSYLALSFMEGKLSFIDPAAITKDAIRIDGAYYWHLGPFPAVLLIPLTFAFKLIHQFFFQGYLQLLLTAAIFWMGFAIGRRHSFSVTDSLYLAFGFCFASVYQFVALLSWSWYFSHVVAVALLFLIIWEYMNKKRYWLIGILFAAVFATRFSAGLTIGFFLLDIAADDKKPRAKKLSDFAALLLPVFLCGLALMEYNLARFGSFFENGYRLVGNHVEPESVKDERYYIDNYGLFKLKNIPTNLYYYFIKTVDPVVIDQPWVGNAQTNPHILKFPFVRPGPPGIGFFVVAPMFLYAFRAKWSEKLVRQSWAALLPVLFVLLCYYWPGWLQVGPRYMLDLLPFAYLLLMFSFEGNRLTNFCRGLILVSALADLYLFFALPEALFHSF